MDAFFLGVFIHRNEVVWIVIQTATLVLTMLTARLYARFVREAEIEEGEKK